MVELKNEIENILSNPQNRIKEHSHFKSVQSNIGQFISGKSIAPSPDTNRTSSPNRVDVHPVTKKTRQEVEMSAFKHDTIDNKKPAATRLTTEKIVGDDLRLGGIGGRIEPSFGHFVEPSTSHEIFSPSSLINDTTPETESHFATNTMFNQTEVNKPQNESFEKETYLAAVSRSSTGRNKLPIDSIQFNLSSTVLSSTASPEITTSRAMTFKILDLIEKARSNLSSSNDDILKTHARPAVDDISKPIKNNSSITVAPKKLLENEAGATMTQQPIQVKEPVLNEIDSSHVATTSDSKSHTSISTNSIVRDNPTYFVATTTPTIKPLISSAKDDIFRDSPTYLLVPNTKIKDIQGSRLTPSKEADQTMSTISLSTTTTTSTLSIDTTSSMATTLKTENIPLEDSNQYEPRIYEQNPSITSVFTTTEPSVNSNTAVGSIMIFPLPIEQAANEVVLKHPETTTTSKLIDTKTSSSVNKIDTTNKPISDSSATKMSNALLNSETEKETPVRPILSTNKSSISPIPLPSIYTPTRSTTSTRSTVSPSLAANLMDSNAFASQSQVEMMGKNAGASPQTVIAMLKALSIPEAAKKTVIAMLNTFFTPETANNTTVRLIASTNNSITYYILYLLLITTYYTYNISIT